ncbi:hypothetical protein CLIB1423_02S04346 [[Candida] railenensis]|uniref:Uncharacterized protein n=1 Tax=[Candida] railenensis TaxID=45579 RepID=A0A9P0QLC0_9ASCO|nr:hypothetical protein CLIB1423_02S04346 [[Candida] railenensis]
MALRNYMYAKHDNNQHISSMISGIPTKETAEDRATRAKIQSLSLSSEKKESCDNNLGPCRNCPDCPKKSNGADLPKTAIEVENAPRKTEIDYTKMEF